jgi:flavin-dependent dehydrogenase
VAGGGLAGAAAACLLARAGQPVVLVERQAQAADKVCGEFISAEAQAYLGRLGMDLATLGAHPIGALRLVHRTASVARRLPFAGVGLSRRVLDEALLGRAAQLGAEIRRGQVASLTQDRGPIVLDVGGAKLGADTLFLATGKHDLRGLRRTASPSDLVGFKLHLRVAPAQRDALAGHVEILLLQDGYAGLQLIEGGLANLCLLVERSRLQSAGGNWDGLLDQLQRTEPHLRTRLAGAIPQMRPLSIFRVPYGFVHAPAADDPPGIFRLGDQMGVIPSFTGDGMSIALHSAAVAASCYLAGGDAATYHRRIRGDIAGLIARAGAMYRIGSSAPGRAMLMRAAAIWPGGLGLAARMTRVPRQAIAREALAA